MQRLVVALACLNMQLIQRVLSRLLQTVGINGIVAVIILVLASVEIVDTMHMSTLMLLLSTFRIVMCFRVVSLGSRRG